MYYMHALMLSVQYCIAVLATCQTIYTHIRFRSTEQAVLSDHPLLLLLCP